MKEQFIIWLQQTDAEVWRQLGFQVAAGEAADRRAGERS